MDDILLIGRGINLIKKLKMNLSRDRTNNLEKTYKILKNDHI